MTRRLVRLSAVLLLAIAGSPRTARAQEPLPSAKIRDLGAVLKDGSLYVTFRVTGPFTPEVLEKLQAASTVVFRHRIRVVRKRALWAPKVLAERTIETSVRYDNLTRQYTLRRAGDEGAGETMTTENDEEMRRFMTEVRDERVAGLDALEGEDRVTVQVRTEFQDTWLLFMFPWSYKAYGEKDLNLPR